MFEEETHSTDPNGFISGYHQRCVPSNVPVVTLVQVKSVPLTPRPGAFAPARKHSSPTFAFEAGFAPAFADGAASKDAAIATAPSAITFFLSIFSPLEVPH
jgi:hypothetical protein